ncbi:hypothetical protein [Jeongeupia chitinilytica]|uniref:Uncharacterized protein n=1 Tax=Jeongeupia chitinilytica TaxID=1041641 RepID=A0ABQ3H3F3_9NEIS|nr:hypothetical protein [Jeongeupia chitinilytica]GHD68483.1 hypothetical protein GCM10007350_33890 [Jeongeupia chitinilytica]
MLIINIVFALFWLAVFVAELLFGFFAAPGYVFAAVGFAAALSTILSIRSLPTSHPAALAGLASNAVLCAGVVLFSVRSLEGGNPVGSIVIALPGLIAMRNVLWHVCLLRQLKTATAALTRADSQVR